jgi:hypothetical protein
MYPPLSFIKLHCSWGLPKLSMNIIFVFSFIAFSKEPSNISDHKRSLYAVIDKSVRKQVVCASVFCHGGHYMVAADAMLSMAYVTAAAPDDVAKRANAAFQQRRFLFPKMYCSGICYPCSICFPLL